VQLFKISVFLASAAAGFLFWNRPPARIFMGDVGSGFLGFSLAVLVLMAAHQLPILLISGIILFGVFFVDATYTLLYRFFTGQKWYEAHCSHTYQYAAKQYGHLKVLLAVWIINLFWLLPVALWVFYKPEYNLAALLVAYTPLVYLAYKFKAGSQS
jgi:Fuc2NAc and GlcNAc transferase